MWLEIFLTLMWLNIIFNHKHGSFHFKTMFMVPFILYMLWFNVLSNPNMEFKKKIEGCSWFSFNSNLIVVEIKIEPHDTCCLKK